MILVSQVRALARRREVLATLVRRDLRVRYAPSSGNWGVEAFGQNVLDEEYIKDAGNTGDALGMPTFIAGRPAAYGVGFKLKL